MKVPATKADTQEAGTVTDVRTPELKELAEEGPAPSAAWWRGALIGAGALVLAIGVLVLIWLTARPLALFFAAIVIAEAVGPLVDRLERRLPRGLAVGLLYVGMLGLLSALMWFFAPRLVQQAQELADEAPTLVARGQDLIEQWAPGGQNQISSAIQGNLDRFTNVLITVPIGLVSSLTQIILVFFLSAYWLVSKPALHTFARSLFPRRHRSELDRTLGALSHSVGGYVRGEVVSAIIIGVLVYSGMLIIGVDYPLVLALIAAFGELIPVIGGVPAVVVAFLDSPTQGLIVVGFYVVLQQIESNIIIPNVMENQADVPPLLVLLAIFAGGSLGGILGALVAIPLAGAIKVLVVRVVAPEVRRWSGANAQ